MQQSAENQLFVLSFSRLIRRCLLFSLPLAIVLVPAVSILLVTDEICVDVDDIVARSGTEPLLIGFAYNDRHYSHLKFRRLTSLPRQSVVALGSSRVLPFREDMFTADFYNAGYTVVSPWDFRTFMQQVPNDLLPSTVILGLDQFMFNPDNNRNRPPRDATAWTERPQDDLQSAMKLIPDVYKDLFRGQISLSAVIGGDSESDDVDKAGTIGLNALINDKGMRNDGSFLYGRHIDQLLADDTSARDFGFQQTLARVKRHSNRFEAGSEIDMDAIEEIRLLLDFCHQRDIRVVAFLPPYADVVWQAMQDSGEFRYTTQIETALRPMFDDYDFELYAFHCMADCDATDQEAIDGFHAGEQTYLKILVTMLRQGSVLNEFTDLAALQNDLTQLANRYTAYEEPTSATLRVAQATSEASQF